MQYFCAQNVSPTRRFQIKLAPTMTSFPWNMYNLGFAATSAMALALGPWILSIPWTGLMMLLYAGGLDTPVQWKPRQLESAPMVGFFWRGSYYQAREQFSKLHEIIGSVTSVKYTEMGVYWDDPSQVAANEGRNFIGALIENEDAREAVLKSTDLVQLRFDTPLKGLSAKMPLRTRLGRLCGPMVAYDHWTKKFVRGDEELAAKYGPPLEIYRDEERVIEFFWPENSWNLLEKQLPWTG